MRRLVEMRDALVQTINRERVLNKIVRADAKEIDFAREHIRRNGRARDLDHCTGFDFVADLDPGGAQFFPAFI